MRPLLRSCGVLEITGGAPQLALNRLVKDGVAFWDIRWVDAVTVQVCIFDRAAKQAVTSVRRAQCEGVLTQTVSPGKRVTGLLHRPVLLFGLLLALAMVMVLPQFVFFYEVQGNETVPAAQILRELEALGIGFGTRGTDIRPHWIKNQLISRIPELSWVTVTQNGCRAVVTVRERSRAEDIQGRKGCANLVATRSGIITDMSVLAGQPLVQVGDTVDAGQMLVSGIVDLERIWHLEYARAEIFARTWRKNQAVIPAQYTGKGDLTGEKQCIWLIFKNRRIKIFGNSGISYGSCDKMIETKVWTLPGGRELPIRLEIETFRFYTPEHRTVEPEEARNLLEDGICRRTLAQMQAGKIVRADTDLYQSEGVFRLDAVLECHEMIAGTVPVMWNEDKTNDGTYSQRRENGADH